MQTMYFINKQPRNKGGKNPTKEIRSESNELDIKKLLNLEYVKFRICSKMLY